MGFIVNLKMDLLKILLRISIVKLHILLYDNLQPIM